MMKKNIFALCTAAACLQAAAFPLEWNQNNKTDVCYETEISRAKLEKLAGANKNCGFKVIASTADGKQNLDVTLLEGRQKGSTALRFTVPAGTTALDCELTDNGTVSQQDKAINLFDGALDNVSAWKKIGKCTLKSVNGKLLFENLNFSDVTYSCTVDVPEQAAGMGAKLELDFKSLTPEPWPCNINIEQLDADGKVLSESLTDPRWITLMRPEGILTAHRESGRFHPQVKKISIKIKARGYATLYGSNGMKVKDKTTLLPKFEISRLSVRAAEELPFPKYRDEFFAAGVTGKAGDFAFDTTKGIHGKTFFYATHSQACWAEGKAITNYDELFYPAGDGTVEAWFKPVWSSKDKNNSFYYLFSADPHPNIGPMRAANRKTKHCLAAKYFPKSKKMTIDFQDYTKKTYSKTFKCNIPAKEWSHVAVQWGKTNGIQVFVNGKKVFDDKKFTYTPVDFSLPMIKNSKYRGYIPMANEFMATQVSLGNDRESVRSAEPKTPNFRGHIDALRVSSVKRYDGNFTPAKSFEVDTDTRALFDFNRSFDGKSGGGIKYISGTAWAEVSRVDSQVCVNGKTIDYIPQAICSDNHPDKILDKRNYTQVPNAKDFVAARKSEKLVFDFKGNDKKTVNLPDRVFMDFIEYKNTGSKTVVHPFIRRDGEIDPRSFADIARSMNLEKLTQKERLNRIFQFMLSSSDYYASHQLYFEPGTDTPENACYKALTMLNSYCGFECGPLNNMTANMFTCSGYIPASQTGGYGHSFQQAWVDGKSNLYDLSAQKFFPSFDNTTPSSLGESELEPGVFSRVGGGSNSFIRMGTRLYGAQYPGFTERVAMELRPGETLRMWFANNGRFNDLQYYAELQARLTPGTYKDVTKLVHIKKTKRPAPVLELRRIFPDYGSTFLYFNASPSKFAKTFTKVTADSFCYNVVSCYPVVYAEYTAKLKDGSFAEFEISTDRGKTFRTLERDKDGSARPFYPVCGRREYLIKVKAPVQNVENFNAMTQMITNPRVMTGKLAKGRNELIYTAENNADVKVTMQYRKYAKDINITGELIRSGAQKGFERFTTAIAPGEEKTFDVTGVSAKATVKTTGALKAELANGKLTVSVPDGDIKSIETATVVDNGAEKQLVVVIYPHVEIVTAKDITPVAHSKLTENEIQKSIDLNGRNARVKINLKKTKPAGKYSVWNCVRLSNKIEYLRTTMDLPQGGTQEVFRHLNSATEFLKSKFYGDNDRGKFTWTCHNNHYYTYPAHDMQKDFDSLTYKVVISFEDKIELAGTIVLPYPDEKFFDSMVETLCGLNHNKWYVDEHNAAR